MNTYKIPQVRWTCPHCRAEGWRTPGSRINGRYDHARPNGTVCRKARDEGDRARDYDDVRARLARKARGRADDRTLDTAATYGSGCYRRPHDFLASREPGSFAREWAGFPKHWGPLTNRRDVTARLACLFPPSLGWKDFLSCTNVG
jgi:hypothetical protein